MWERICFNGLFKLIIMIVKQNNSKSISYFVKSSNLWHGRLRHINYNFMHKLININYTPSFQIDIRHKCESCVATKLIKSLFQIIEKNIEPFGI